MTNRITKFECSVLDNTNINRNVLCSYKWEKDSVDIKTIWSILNKTKKYMPSISYDEFVSCVRDCKENSNIQIDDEFGYTLMVRRWSYHRNM